MRNFIKLLQVEWQLFRLSAMADLQMRFNLLTQFFNDALWYIVQIIMFEAIYLHVTHLGGWGIAETRVFLGMLFVADGLQMFLFAYNFDHFSEKVSRGDLDLTLMKPGSSLQLFTSQRMQCGYLLNIALALAWLLWSLSGLPGGISLRHLLLLILVPAALTVFYSTRLIFNLPSILFSNAGNMSDTYFYLFRLGQRPDRLYGPGLRYLVLMIVPVAMVASVPTRVLVEPFDFWTLTSVIGVAGTYLMAAIGLWRLALRRYASASS